MWFHAIPAFSLSHSVKNEYTQRNTQLSESLFLLVLHLFYLSGINLKKKVKLLLLLEVAKPIASLLQRFNTL